MATVIPLASKPLDENSAAAAARAQVAHIKPGRLFINGKFREAEGGKTRDDIDPSTEEVVTTVAEGSTKDVDDAVAAAREAFDNGPWSRLNPFERGELLPGGLLSRLSIARETLRHEKPLMSASRLLRQKAFDVPQGAAGFAFYGSLAGQLDGSTRPGNGASMVYTRREPLGVVAGISPFNFPLNLSINKIAPALAAGNTIVHKPAGETPLSALLLAEVLRDSGIPDGVYNLVTGSGSVAGAHLMAHRGVDKIAFTGSTEVGKHIQEVAAKSLKRVTLELGGKNALIVFADAVEGPASNLDALVEIIFLAAYFNCGQFCMGCSRLLVEGKVHDSYDEKIDSRALREQTTCANLEI